MHNVIKDDRTTGLGFKPVKIYRKGDPCCSKKTEWPLTTGAMSKVT
jgi:hypothetical protein